MVAALKYTNFENKTAKIDVEVPVWNFLVWILTTIWYIILFSGDIHHFYFPLVIQLSDTYIHACMHAYIHTNIHTYCIHVYIHTYIHTYRLQISVTKSLRMNIAYGRNYLTEKTSCLWFLGWKNSPLLDILHTIYSNLQPFLSYNVVKQFTSRTIL